MGKSLEMSQIFIAEGLPEGIMHVTLKLHQSLRSILRFRFCNWYVLLEAIFKQENSKCAHLVAKATRGRLKEYMD